MTLSDKKIIHKVIDGESSKENAQYVAEWFSSTIEGQQMFSEMIDRDAYLMEEKLLDENKISATQSDQLLKKIQLKIRIKRIKHLTLSVAAVLVPFVIIVGLGIYLNTHIDLFKKTTYSEIYIPKGERARILFQDGTEAFLNSDSKIRYPNKFGFSKRVVQLQGEAYFIVSHNKNRPFIVESGNTSVKVLGTSFNVNAYQESENIQVTLDEGSIVFNSPGNQYQLTPGQLIVYDKTNENYTVRNLSKSVSGSSWTENILHLNDTPLSDVLQILERRFNVVFTVENTRSLEYSYTITTKETKLENILAELQKIAPVKFTQLKDSIEVSLF